MTGENGVADGIRTHDNRNHNPGLYQLSYRHHRLAALRAARGPDATVASEDVHYTKRASSSASRADQPMTSAASSCSEYGTFTPSPLAVVKLTLNSNLDGCSTGRSAGFSPRSILST